jgi:hypothetical protein
MEQDFGRYLFKVGDRVPSGSDGPTRDPFIWCETVDKDMELLRSRKLTMGFRLREGASQEEAEKVASFLNEHLAAITVW